MVYGGLHVMTVDSVAYVVLCEEDAEWDAGVTGEKAVAFED